MKEGKDRVQSLLLEEGERDGGWDLGIAGQPACREPLRSRALWPLAVRRLNSTSVPRLTWAVDLVRHRFFLIGSWLALDSNPLPR